eukprot:842334_1
MAALTVMGECPGQESHKNVEITNEDHKMNNNKNLHEENSDLEMAELQQFIEEYKLQPIANKLTSEGINIAFLLSLSNETEIEDIGKELTANKIQQKKFKYAVLQLQLKHKKDKIKEIDQHNDDEDKEDDNAHVPPGHDFTGVWKIRDYENFENYLIDEGYGWIKRNVALKIDSMLTTTHVGNVIKMDVKNSMNVLFQEDTNHGNAINPFIIDGKTYEVKGASGHVVKKTSNWNDDQTSVICKSHDINTNQIIVYQIYIDQNNEFCLKRTNQNGIWTIFHYARAKK